ncbi:UpxY family transcription antiterminator [Mucilaginibacter ginsenosidivorans]|uniref:UpxY family transcription antiterminator n=1 Tax=Mucilaginibacter ginsenosidivorans TaxID=398053 RepID=A0A5B8UUV8_9SPHI|nr:UpxY family transcription antiterminator [Mucilaginibacter ginsenosidivorans]QEC62555.1 UpxY family transcription antiterminator [Mucilaginibacter ginsenosidivorans]
MDKIKSKAASHKWYPVYTHPRAEKKACQALSEKGIETYLPLRRQVKQWSDRKKWVEEPLIKSYLFVHISDRDQAEVLMTRGVVRFIYFGGKIAFMPDSQIRDLKLLMASPAELEITEENLLPGEKIVIKAGPLKGMTGEIISYRSQKLLALRLEGLGCSIIIHIAASLIGRF